MRDPYEVLGVSKGADIAEVKKAFRRLARDHHPDLHPGDKKAEDRFKEISTAYEFLDEPDRKKKYDASEIDASGAPKMERQFYRDFAEAGQGDRYTESTWSFRDMGGTEDIFANLFRGMRRDQRKARGTDVQQRVSVDFLDAINGAQRPVVLHDGRRITVTIPPGSRDGQVLRLKGQGMPSPTDGPPGDLFIELSVRPHPTFAREGDDIVAELPVTLPEAVLGGKVAVPTVDGSVNLTVPPGTNTGTRMRIRGKGVPSADRRSRGDQYVTIKVMLPDKPDDELRAFLENWSKAHPYRVRGN